jgi:hypothetical protein
MLRVEPAHQEAFVALTTGPEGTPPAESQLASEALRAWEEDDGIKPEQLDLGPDDLGVRITYLATPPITATSGARLRLRGAVRRPGRVNTPGRTQLR